MIFSMPDADSDEEMASETSSFIICQKCGERLRPAMTRCRNCGTVIPRIIDSAESRKSAAPKTVNNSEASIVEEVLMQAPSVNQSSLTHEKVQSSPESAPQNNPPQDNTSNPPEQKPANAGRKSPGRNSDADDGFIRFTCRCGKQLRAKPQWVGKSLKCPGCGKKSVVP